MQARRKHADVTKRLLLRGKGSMAHLGLTALDGSAILRSIHPLPLGQETPAMATLADYAEKYQTIRMERRDGILQMTFHTDGHTAAMLDGHPDRLDRSG
jgi:hypothetical protein